MQVSQESTRVGVFLNKVPGPQNWSFIETPPYVFSYEICEISKNTLFYRASPTVDSKSFWFPVCNFIKKETPAKMFFCEFFKIFKNIFSFDRARPDDFCEVLQLYEEKLTSCITSSFVYLPSFSQIASRLLFPKRLWKCASTISFRKFKRKVVLLVIYLFNYDSSKPTFFMLNMVFDVLLSTAFVE